MEEKVIDISPEGKIEKLCKDFKELCNSFYNQYLNTNQKRIFYILHSSFLVELGYLIQHYYINYTKYNNKSITKYAVKMSNISYTITDIKFIEECKKFLDEVSNIFLNINKEKIEKLKEILNNYFYSLDEYDTTNIRK